MLTRHARHHSLEPPYLTVDGRLAWRASSSSSARIPLVPHPPRNPPPTLLHVPPLHVAAQPAGPLPAATSILGPTAPQSASIVILPDPLRPPPSVLPLDQANTPAPTRPVALTEALALGPVDVKSTKGQGTRTSAATMTVTHRADGGAEQSSLRGKTLEF